MIRSVVGLITVGALAACSASTDREQPASPTAEGSVTQAIGIDFDLGAVTNSQAPMSVISAMRRVTRVCPNGEQDCAPNVTYRVLTTILIDFQTVLTSDLFELIVPNNSGSEQRTTSEFSPTLGPGSHCVVSISQFFPVAGVPIEEAEGVIARMDTISVGPGTNHCLFAGLTVLESQLRETDTWDCGAQPNVSLMDGEEFLPQDLMQIRVAACDFDSVILQIMNGKLDLPSVSVMQASDKTGFHVIMVPRPISGTFRLVWVPMDPADHTQLGQGLDYTPLAVSPPYSFPADLGSP